MGDLAVYGDIADRRDQAARSGHARLVRPGPGRRRADRPQPGRRRRGHLHDAHAARQRRARQLPAVPLHPGLLAQLHRHRRRRAASRTSATASADRRHQALEPAPLRLPARRRPVVPIPSAARAGTAAPTSPSWPSSCASSPTAARPTPRPSRPGRPSPRVSPRPPRCARRPPGHGPPARPRAGRLVRGRPGFGGDRGSGGGQAEVRPRTVASHRRVDVGRRIVLPAGRSLHRVMQGRSGLNERDGMGADGRLLRLFEGHRLTPTQRRIAHCMVRRAADAPFLSSVELAELAGVSQPSVTRFAVALGFDGYPALRRHLREAPPGTAAGEDARGRPPTRTSRRCTPRSRTCGTSPHCCADPAPVERAGRLLAASRPLPVLGLRAAAAQAARIRATSRPRSTRTSGCSWRAARCSPTAWRPPYGPAPSALLCFALPRHPREVSTRSSTPGPPGSRSSPSPTAPSRRSRTRRTCCSPRPSAPALAFDTACAPMLLGRVLLEAMCDGLPDAQARLEDFDARAAERGCSRSEPGARAGSGFGAGAVAGARPGIGSGSELRTGASLSRFPSPSGSHCHRHPYGTRPRNASSRASGGRPAGAGPRGRTAGRGPRRCGTNWCATGRSSTNSAAGSGRPYSPVARVMSQPCTPVPPRRSARGPPPSTGNRRC